MRAVDVMTSGVITVGENATVPEAARLLAEHGISAVPVVDEALEDSRGDDPAAADHHGALAVLEILVDVLVRLVGVDDVAVVVVPLAVLLKVREELQPRIADGYEPVRSRCVQPGQQQGRR